MTVKSGGPHQQMTTKLKIALYAALCWFQRRFPLFFQEGTFEIYELWDDETLVTHSVKLL